MSQDATARLTAMARDVDQAIRSSADCPLRELIESCQRDGKPPLEWVVRWSAGGEPLGCALRATSSLARKMVVLSFCDPQAFGMEVYRARGGRMIGAVVRVRGRVVHSGFCAPTALGWLEFVVEATGLLREHGEPYPTLAEFLGRLRGAS